MDKFIQYAHKVVENGKKCGIKYVWVSVSDEYVRDCIPKDGSDWDFDSIRSKMLTELKKTWIIDYDCNINNWVRVYLY